MPCSENKKKPCQFLARLLYWFVSILSLDVRQLFADETVLQFEDIDSAHMSLFSWRIQPIVFPAHDTVKPQGKNLLDLNVSLWWFAEEVSCQNCVTASFSFIHRSIRGRICVLKKDNRRSLIASSLLHRDDWRLHWSQALRASLTRSLTCGLDSYRQNLLL